MTITVQHMFACFLTFVFFQGNVFAGVMASATRVIFHQGELIKPLMLINTNPYPVLMQLWVDDGEFNNTPDKTYSPFLVIPPIFKMDTGEIKNIKILYNDTQLVKHHESMLWLNLYEVPPEQKIAPSDTVLMMSMKTQMKIIYRPVILDDNLQEQFNVIACHVAIQHTETVTCNNPTGYFVNLAGLTRQSGPQFFQAQQEIDMMIAPFSSKRFVMLPSEKKPLEPANKMTLSIIDDQGGVFEKVIAIE